MVVANLRDFPRLFPASAHALRASCAKHSFEVILALGNLFWQRSTIGVVVLEVIDPCTHLIRTTTRAKNTGALVVGEETPLFATNTASIAPLVGRNLLRGGPRGDVATAMCQVCAALGIQKRSSYGPEEGGRFRCFEHREPGDVRRR